MANQNDGVSNVNAGAKPGNGDPDGYEAETEETAAEASGDDLLDDADTVTGAGAAHSPSGFGKVNDEETLLDASECDSANLPSGTDFPAADPAVGGSPSSASGISNPTPEVSGIASVSQDASDDELLDD